MPERDTVQARRGGRPGPQIPLVQLQDPGYEEHAQVPLVDDAERKALAQVSLEDSDGAVLWIGQCAAAAIFPDVDFQGYALATGDGLVLKNAGTTTAIFNGRVTADQY